MIFSFTTSHHFLSNMLSSFLHNTRRTYIFTLLSFNCFTNLYDSFPHFSLLFSFLLFPFLTLFLTVQHATTFLPLFSFDYLHIFLDPFFPSFLLFSFFLLPSLTSFFTVQHLPTSHLFFSFYNPSLPSSFYASLFFPSAPLPCPSLPHYAAHKHIFPSLLAEQ